MSTEFGHLPPDRRQLVTTLLDAIARAEGDGLEPADIAAVITGIAEVYLAERYPRPRLRVVPTREAQT
jgi:hypothetical protein